MSVAAVCPRATEEEHWRYLPAGLRFVLADFSTVRIVPEVSSIGGFFRTNNWSLSILVKYGWLKAVLHHTLVPILNLAGQTLEWAFPINNDQLTGNYSVLAQK